MIGETCYMTHVAVDSMAWRWHHSRLQLVPPTGG